jgi:hypothetical protein
MQLKEEQVDEKQVDEKEVDDVDVDDDRTLIRMRWFIRRIPVSMRLKKRKMMMRRIRLR